MNIDRRSKMGVVINVNPSKKGLSQTQDQRHKLDNCDTTHILLKIETQSLHQKLDNNIFLQNLLHPSLTKETLAQALKGFYIAYNSLREHGILKACSQLNVIDFKQLPYNLWLTADLTRLNQKPIYHLNKQTYLPQSEAEVLGCLYVILGSSMGSARIANALKNHDDKIIQDIQFFSKVAENSSNFRLLLNEIELKTSHPIAQKACINAAKSTFNIFIESFEIVMATHNNGKVFV